MKLDPCLSSYTKFNSERVKNLDVKLEILEQRREGASGYRDKQIYPIKDSNSKGNNCKNRQMGSCEVKKYLCTHKK